MCQQSRKRVDVTGVRSLGWFDRPIISPIFRLVLVCCFSSMTPMASVIGFCAIEAGKDFGDDQKPAVASHRALNGSPES